MLSSKEAGVRFSVTHDYVTLLCRRRKVRAFFVGRVWFVDEGSLRSYLEGVEKERHARRQALSEKFRRERNAATTRSNL